MGITTNHYCSQCGTRLEGDFAFCPECGTQVASKAASTQQPTQQQQSRQEQDYDRQPFMQVPDHDPFPQQQKPPRQPIKLSKAAIISIASGLVVILLVVGAYFTGKYMTDEERLISKFERIAADGDADKLYKLLAGSNEDVKFDQETADEIAAYLKDNEDVIRELAEELRSEAEELKSGEVDTFREHEDAPFLYMEKKDKKKWLLFNDYELKLKRYMVPVWSNFDGASVEVDGIEAGQVSSEASREVGPLLPGKYEVKVVYEGEYTTLENKREVELFPMDEYDDSVELELKGDYISVYADNTEADIYINGQSIGLKADGAQEIGPISLDGSNTVYVQAEYPWGTSRSEEQQVTGEQLEFAIDPLADGEKETIMASANTFVKSWLEATQAKDSSLATNLNQEMLERLNNNLATYESYGQLYFGEISKLTYDLDSFEVYDNGDGEYSVSVKMREDYSEAIAYPDSDYELVPMSADLRFLLDYVDGDWIVTEVYNVYDFSDANTKIFE